MVWHHKGRKEDNVLKHLADAKALKDFDEQYPPFAADPSNVGLGLASDG